MACECDRCKYDKKFEMPKQLIEAAANGDLVLFCGSGISTEGKTVLPFTFYSSIKDELNIEDDISFCDLMEQFCVQPNGRKELLLRIRKRFEYIHSFPELERQATSFHSELSGIHQISTIITTNWDTYFEEYCKAIPIVIPADFAFWDDRSRFVIKLHGSINNLSTIVATKKDYEKCFNQLRDGVIGATLKTILATKTIVFIGFSFSDEDFNQIINYLKSEMGELYPHIYIVTLDENLNERVNYENATTIVTSGWNFIHQLKMELIEEGNIVNCAAPEIVPGMLETLRDLHEKISHIDLEAYPNVIYTLAYQDGVIHAFERFLQTYQTGEYYRPGRIELLGNSYEKKVGECQRNGNYWDKAYYEGYLNGLIFIGVCSKEIDVFDAFPLLYLPTKSEGIFDLEEYKKELDKNKRGKYYKYAKEIVDKRYKKGMVVHHPPI